MIVSALSIMNEQIKLESKIYISPLDSVAINDCFNSIHFCFISSIVKHLQFSLVLKVQFSTKSLVLCINTLPESLFIYMTHLKYTLKNKYPSRLMKGYFSYIF